MFVSNIPYSYGEEEIIAAFDNLQITKVRVVTTSLGRSRGFCFVDLANKVRLAGLIGGMCLASYGARGDQL